MFDRFLNTPPTTKLVDVHGLINNLRMFSLGLVPFRKCEIFFAYFSRFGVAGESQ